MRIFNKVNNFIKRFCLAWKFAADKNLLNRVTALVNDELEEKTQKARIQDLAPVVVGRLLPSNRHEMKFDDPRQPVRIKIRSKETIGSREADQILEESKRNFKLHTSQRSIQKALTEHDEKFRYKIKWRF